jgi:hypothetical protein
MTINGYDHMQYRLAMQQIHTTFDKHLWLPNWWMIDVFCATILCNWIDGLPPVWLMIVAPPATGKTVFIESASELPGVFQVGGLSENAIVSGMPWSRRQRRGEARRTEARGLLERVSDDRDYENGVFRSRAPKLVAIKDMTSLISGRPETRGKVLAQLREIYDGSFSWEWGTQAIQWTGKVGIIAGCTNAWDRHMLEGNNLGERFIYWRIPRGYGKEATLQAMRQVSKPQMEKELAGAVGLLGKLRIPKAESIDSSPLQPWLVELATRTAILRTEFTRDFKGVPDEPARHESGARIGRQFDILVKGLMLVKGLDNPNVNDVKYPMVRVAMSSIPLTRLDIFCNLDPLGETLESLRDKVQMPRTSLGRHVVDLCTLGVISKISEIEYAVAEGWEDWQAKFKHVYGKMGEEYGT